MRSFDIELAHFLWAILGVIFEMADIRDAIDQEIDTYLKVWAIMKVCILSSMCRLLDRDFQLTRK